MFVILSSANVLFSMHFENENFIVLVIIVEYIFHLLLFAIHVMYFVKCDKISIM